jgi:hypothetical protein
MPLGTEATDLSLCCSKIRASCLSFDINERVISSPNTPTHKHARARTHTHTHTQTHNAQLLVPVLDLYFFV